MYSSDSFPEHPELMPEPVTTTGDISRVKKHTEKNQSNSGVKHTENQKHESHTAQVNDQIVGAFQEVFSHTDNTDIPFTALWRSLKTEDIIDVDTQKEHPAGTYRSDIDLISFSSKDELIELKNKLKQQLKNGQLPGWRLEDGSSENQLRPLFPSSFRLIRESGTSSERNIDWWFHPADKVIESLHANPAEVAMDGDTPVVDSKGNPIHRRQLFATMTLGSVIYEGPEKFADEFRREVYDFIPENMQFSEEEPKENELPETPETQRELLQRLARDIQARVTASDIKATLTQKYYLIPDLFLENRIKDILKKRKTNFTPLKSV